VSGETFATVAPLNGKESQMTLERGSFRSFEFDRMVVLFSMMDGAKEVPLRR
jgi:hypothetical protein